MIMRARATSHKFRLEIKFGNDIITIVKLLKVKHILEEMSTFVHDYVMQKKHFSQ